MQRRPSFIVLALLVIAGLFSACEVQAPKDPHTLIYHLGSEPDTLNRLTATDAYEGRINGFIFDSLIERDNATLEFKPKMAKSWEVSDDKLVYTFHLRDDIKWHDGKPFNADDVIYTFQKIMDEKVDAPHLRVYYKDIKNLEKLDDYTVRFTYAIPYFKALEFVGGIPIIPKHVFDDGKDFNSHPAGRFPIGNGPYKFKRWDTGSQIVLERNEEYWDKTKFPDIRRIVFKIIPDDIVAFQRLKKGDLDMDSLNPKQWVKQSNTPTFEKLFAKHQYYTPSYRYVGWNLRRPYFQDKKVRQALARLINRQGILKNLEYGLGKLTTGPFWIFGYEYDQTLPQIPFDPAGAKKLLDEAGWIDHDGDGIRDKDGVKFSFKFLIPSGAEFYQNLATIMKRDFAEAGIEMEIQTMEWATFVQQLNSRDFDAVSLAWSFGYDEDPYQVWHSSQAEKGSNFVGFQNGEADRLMEEARQVFDKDKRAELFHQMHRIIYDEQPYAFLYSGPALVARSRRFENVKVYPGGVDILEWKVGKQP
ncbi:MAG: peptide-binding protein [Deltaproteobacteria bacterium]|nr:peptide-binding protein [Deltaproteobacteria bacterium]